ncbi:hypothetical protein BY458DRAFT_553788 [Sporodiniella umbellata]|nr:hypothetical protein BY458DRAFT_553788 [Sporodiniella umbellata]
MSKRKISCASCRSKKLKCNGEKPCFRCQDKAIECIYTRPGQAGRPPKKGLVNKFVHTQINNTVCREFVFEHPSPSHSSHIFQLKGFACYLKNIFVQRFLYTKPVIQEQFRVMTRKIFSKVDIEDLAHFFVWMGGDMIVIFMRRISDLKLPHTQCQEYLTSTINQDPSVSFFDECDQALVTNNPLNSLPSHQALQLIDSFFLIYPCSILLSKSSILEAYWKDTADPLLLSVIYGTTLFMSRVIEGHPLDIWTSHNLEVRNPFLEHAHRLLAQMPAEATLSRYQAIVLLAMFESMYGYFKKGVTLIIVSYDMAHQLGVLEDNTLLSPLEKELLGITYWAAFHCTARGYIELIKHSDHGFPPYPPINLLHSLSARPDVEDGNRGSYKHVNQLIETFYVQSVISKLCYDLLPALLNASDRADQKIKLVMNDFCLFIESNRTYFSKLQEFTLELYYSLFMICIGFLKEPASKGRLTVYTPKAPNRLDLKDTGRQDQIYRTVQEAVTALDKIANFINGDPTHYYSKISFLPRSLISATLNGITSVLMYHYTLQPTTSIRQYLELIEIIYYNPLLWEHWERIESMRYELKEFLESHPSSPPVDMAGFSCSWFDILLQESFINLSMDTSEWGLPADLNMLDMNFM